MTGIDLFPARWPAPSRVFAATTIRIGGCSAGPYASLNLADHVGDEAGRVRDNRQRLAESLAKNLGFPARFQWLRQVHGNRHATVTEAGPAPEADSLITRAPGIALCVLTADCLPVFVVSRRGDEIAIIHAGWRGLRAGIIGNTLAAMRGKAEDLLVWLGPAIQPDRYEVGEDVREAFLRRGLARRESQATAAAFTPGPKPGKYQADLPRIAKIQLQALGVTAITGGTHCTHGDPTRFYSHRRDGPCGRMASLICIKTTP